jgi:hypothetical protein
MRSSGGKVRPERNRNVRRLILIIAILGAAAATVLSILIVPWARDQIDPLWRVHRAFDEIEVPEQWQLVHQEEVDERFLTPWSGAAPSGKRIYLAREESRRACRTAAEIVAGWSQRDVERVRVREFPAILYRCRSYSEKDEEVVATFTVWDRDGWRSEEFRPDLRHPIGNTISIVELYVLG